jgi:hypothetical protein
MDQNDPQAEMAAIHKQVGGWFEGFIHIPPYQALSDIQRDKAPGVVRFFTEFPLHWSGAGEMEPGCPQGMLSRDIAQKNVG